jgi:hypothetical protein
MTGTLHEDLRTFVISCGILRIIRNISDRSSRENQNTHFIFSNFFPESLAVFDTICKNIVEPDRSEVTM